MTNIILKIKNNKFFKSRMLQIPKFLLTFPHHLWRRSGSPMAGPKPQKGDSQSPSESLLESLSSWRLNDKRIIKQTRTYWQTLHFPMGKTAYLVEFSLQLNMVDFKYSILFNVYLPSSSLFCSLGYLWDKFWIAHSHRSLSNYVIGFHCSDCSWAFLSSSLSACIRSYNNQPTEATKMHPHRRSKQKETDSRVPWTKVCLFGFRYHSSLKQNPTKSIQSDMDSGNSSKWFACLTKQRPSVLSWAISFIFCRLQFL